MDPLSRLISFFLYPDFSGWLLALKMIMISISVLMVVGIIYFERRGKFLKEKYGDLIYWKEFVEQSDAKILRDWNRAYSRLKSRQEDDWKLGIIEADDVMEKILRKIGKKEGAVSERIQAVSEEFPALDANEIIWAHEIRRKISRDPNYKIMLEEARRVFSAYHKLLVVVEMV